MVQGQVLKQEVGAGTSSISFFQVLLCYAFEEKLKISCKLR